MSKNNKKIVESFNEILIEKEIEIVEIIKEIKIQRQETINNPSGGNVTSLVCWYDCLLAKLDKAA